MQKSSVFPLTLFPLWSPLAEGWHLMRSKRMKDLAVFSAKEVLVEEHLLEEQRRRVGVSGSLMASRSEKLAD